MCPYCSVVAEGLDLKLSSMNKIDQMQLSSVVVLMIKVHFLNSAVFIVVLLTDLHMGLSRCVTQHFKLH